jgi:1-deoxy-D-xylulose-5-phosphate reductoisomerase
MKRIAILGSTGSIGQSTLNVISGLKGKFRVWALSAHSNIDLLYRQAKIFSPRLVCVTDQNAYKKLKPRLNSGVRLYCGEDGIDAIVREKCVDRVVLAISGSAGLKPLLKAIDAGKDIALANKESLVMAGDMVMKRAGKKRVNILPVDSEQSAIWQCLNGEDKNKLKNIYLTASGGPFREFSREGLKNICVKQALKHPRWKMGKKITVDCATLMNKGLEVLEAMHLFGVCADRIKVVIHPESVIHSMVEFVDGSVMAQLSVTDMRIPIQYALSYPQRLESNVRGLDFSRLTRLNFGKPDFKKFPCLGLAYHSAREAGTLPCVMNAANEVSVEAFLKGKIRFIAIPVIIEKVMRQHKNIARPDLDQILDADVWARTEAGSIINRLN